MESLRRIFSKLWELASETVFPKSALEKLIETLPAETFLARLPKIRYERGGVEAILPYREPRVRKFIELIKYKGNTEAILLGGQMLEETILSIFSERLPGRENKFVLTGIPASKKRIRERGFDQTGKLCGAIIEAGGGEFLEWRPKLLYRKKEVGSQTEIKLRKNRLENMKDVFAVTPGELVVGRTVVVIDDVTTTGATLKEARSALGKAGARKVYCLALAH